MSLSLSLSLSLTIPYRTKFTDETQILPKITKKTVSSYIKNLATCPFKRTLANLKSYYLRFHKPLGINKTFGTVINTLVDQEQRNHCHQHLGRSRTNIPSFTLQEINILEKTKHTWFPTQKNTSKTYVTDSRNVLPSCARGKVNRFYHSHKNLSLSYSCIYLQALNQHK